MYCRRRCYIPRTFESSTGPWIRTSEDNKQEDMPIGVLPVDSIYTPVRRVNYQVENTRVGRRDDFDKLTLEVRTDGSIMPQESISLATKILTEHLDIFVNLTDEAKNAEIMVEKEETQKEKNVRNDN